MALPFYFKTFKALGGSPILTPRDGLRKHPTSCGLWTCCLTHNSLFSYIEAPGHRLGLPGKETSF